MLFISCAVFNKTFMVYDRISQCQNTDSLNLHKWRKVLVKSRWTQLTCHFSSLIKHFLHFKPHSLTYFSFSTTHTLLLTDVTLGRIVCYRYRLEELGIKLTSQLAVDSFGRAAQYTVYCIRMYFSFNIIAPSLLQSWLPIIDHTSGIVWSQSSFYIILKMELFQFMSTQHHSVCVLWTAPTIYWFPLHSVQSDNLCADSWNLFELYCHVP